MRLPRSLLIRVLDLLRRNRKKKKRIQAETSREELARDQVGHPLSVETGRNLSPCRAKQMTFSPSRSKNYLHCVSFWCCEVLNNSSCLAPREKASFQGTFTLGARAQCPSTVLAGRNSEKMHPVTYRILNV